MRFKGSLHTHTEYSNLTGRDSTNRISDVINYAIELGQEVVAFTEHEFIGNAIKIEEAYNKIKKTNPNFKVILGNEIYLCRNGLANENYQRGVDEFYHFILLAKDAEGHKQIRELSTRAWAHSWRSGKITRRPTYYKDLIEVIGQNPGHVIGSTACLGGFLAKKILQWDSMGRPSAFSKKIVTWIGQMQGIFGKDDFYLEMQPSNNPEQILVNNAIVKLSEKTGAKYIITCDAHYLRKEDRAVHKAFLTAQETEREVDEFYETTYLMSTEEVESYLTYFPSEIINQAYETIDEIKNKCLDYSLFKPLKIPSLTWREPTSIAPSVLEYYTEQMPMMKTFLTSDFEGDSRMVKLIINKLESDERLRNKKHYDEINDNLRITWESSTVNKTHWSAYFLNLQKNIDVCWNSGTLVGPGRGSGVGFLLLYILEITQINPLWENTATFSWRFLNPERVSVLDF